MAMNLLMALDVRPGNPLRLPAFAAAMRVVLGWDPKTTLIAAANSGYLKGCPGLTASAINKFITIEDATEMGHMKQLQQGVRSKLTKSRRGRLPALTQQSTRDAATKYAITTPPQEPGNRKTILILMAVDAPEGFIASDQTGKFPKTSKEGMKYICVFYIFYPNIIKGIPLKSRKKEDLLRA